MKIMITKELLDILSKIRRESTLLDYWRDHAASDWFQTENFCGGFDIIEDEFTFSFLKPQGGEYWFQFSLSKLEDALSGKIVSFEGRAAP